MPTKILSRTTLAGSLALVVDGDSTAAATYGTLPSSGDALAWFRAAEIGLTPAVQSILIDDLAGSGSGVEGARFVGSQEVSGSIRLPITYETFGAVLYWALGGTPSSTGAGPYTHTYPVGTDTPSLSAFVVYEAENGDNLQDEYFGLQVESLELAMEAGGAGYATIQCRGAVALRSSTPQLTVSATETPAAAALTSSLPTLGKQGAVLSFGGNSVAARALTLRLTRPLDRAVDFGASYLARGVLSGAISVTMDVTRAADTDDTATLQAAMLAGTSGDLSISFTSGSKVLYLELSDAVVTSYSAPKSAGGALIESVTFTAQALTTGDYGFRVRITNAASAAVPSNGTMA